MKTYTLAILAIICVGCSSAPPTIQEGPDAELSFDGLHRVDNSRFALAWADPTIDFSRYTKVMPGGAEFQFRTVPQTTTTRRASSGTREFWISEADRERLKQETGAIFAEQLANSTRFEVTDTRGEDVVIIRGAIHDIVSNVPPEMIARGDIWLSSVGEATIVIEIIDSLSNKVIYRGAERRAAQRAGGQTVRANPVTTWAEVRRLMRTWATTMVEGLDSIPAPE